MLESQTCNILGWMSSQMLSHSITPYKISKALGIRDFHHDGQLQKIHSPEWDLNLTLFYLISNTYELLQSTRSNTKNSVSVGISNRSKNPWYSHTCRHIFDCSDNGSSVFWPNVCFCGIELMTWAPLNLSAFIHPLSFIHPFSFIHPLSFIHSFSFIEPFSFI